MRAAAVLRCPTSPALPAMRKPSTATGMTMAIKVSAANTSTSVKAACTRLTTGITRIVGLHLISQPIGGFCNRNCIVLAMTKHNTPRAVFTDETIGRKANHRHVAHARHNLVQLARRHEHGGHLNLNPRVFAQHESHRVAVAVGIAGLLLQTVGPAPRVNPQHHRHTRSEERRVGEECRSRWSPYH